MGVKIGDFELDTSNISPADVDNLRRMLPEELQQPGRLTQLEIILEAIRYIQMLQTKLKPETMKEAYWGYLPLPWSRKYLQFCTFLCILEIIMVNILYFINDLVSICNV